MSLEENNELLAACIKKYHQKKRKSFILFLVLFILGNVIAGAVAIQQSTANVERETKRKMGNVATVEMDWEGFEKIMRMLRTKSGLKKIFIRNHQRWMFMSKSVS